LKYFLDFALDKKENMNGKSHVFGDFILRKNSNFLLLNSPPSPYGEDQQNLTTSKDATSHF
jgi:hypothetical protein